MPNISCWKKWLFEYDVVRKITNLKYENENEMLVSLSRNLGHYVLQKYAYSTVKFVKMQLNENK